MILFRPVNFKIAFHKIKRNRCCISSGMSAFLCSIDEKITFSKQKYHVSFIILRNSYFYYKTCTFYYNYTQRWIYQKTPILLRMQLTQILIAKELLLTRTVWSIGLLYEAKSRKIAELLCKGKELAFWSRRKTPVCLRHLYQ